MEPMRLGFVGLGVMGAPMAGHWVRAGHDVTVWNRTAERAAPLQEQGAKVAADLAELARNCDLIALCVSRSEDVQACLRAMIPHARPGTLFVDHSTIAPAVALELLEELTAAGMRFVDAPITGGSMGAQAGTLTIFMGGDEADTEAVAPYLAAYGRTVARVGGPGQGQVMKMANQIAVGGALLGMAECLAFADRAGLDLTQTHALIGAGAGGSWAFQNYGPKVLNQDWSPGFAITHQRKDFGYVKEYASKIDANVPGTELVDDLLRPLEEEGHGQWTTAALYEVLRKGHTP